MRSSFATAASVRLLGTISSTSKKSNLLNRTGGAWSGGGASQRYILVLDEQLWRDLLITSMSLDSVSRRDGESALTGTLLRRQVYELLKGVRLEEILERLDEIIAILRSRAENDNSLFAQVDDVEELLNLIISLI